MCNLNININLIMYNVLRNLIDYKDNNSANNNLIHHDVIFNIMYLYRDTIISRANDFQKWKIDGYFLLRV